MMKNSSKGGLVYSTETGRMCPDCGQPVAACNCKAGAKLALVGDGVVRVSRQTKGDHCEVVMAALSKLGHQPKRAGA
jgi:translation initiation factor 1